MSSSYSFPKLEGGGGLAITNTNNQIASVAAIGFLPATARQDLLGIFIHSRQGERERASFSHRDTRTHTREKERDKKKAILDGEEGVSELFQGDSTRVEVATKCQDNHKEELFRKEKSTKID